MIQTQENGEKPHFGPNLGPLDQNRAFSVSLMKVNPEKYHCICCINDTVIKSRCEKLFGVKLDYNLTINAHINHICKKAGRELNTI